MSDKEPQTGSKEIQMKSKVKGDRCHPTSLQHFTDDSTAEIQTEIC